LDRSTLYIVRHNRKGVGPSEHVCPAFQALDSDLAKAQQWIDAVRIYPYSHRDKPPAQKVLAPCGKTGSKRRRVAYRFGNSFLRSSIRK
jgi:hypothetical protein